MCVVQLFSRALRGVLFISNSTTYSHIPATRNLPHFLHPTPSARVLRFYRKNPGITLLPPTLPHPTTQRPPGPPHPQVPPPLHCSPP